MKKFILRTDNWVFEAQKGKVTTLLHIDSGMRRAIVTAGDIDSVEMTGRGIILSGESEETQNSYFTTTIDLSKPNEAKVMEIKTGKETKEFIWILTATEWKEEKSEPRLTGFKKRIADMQKETEEINRKSAEMETMKKSPEQFLDKVQRDEGWGKDFFRGQPYHPVVGNLTGTVSLPTNAGKSNLLDGLESE